MLPRFQLCPARVPGMTTDLVPAKTPAGQAELDRRQRALTQRHRTMLFLIDGRRSAEQVKRMGEQAGAPPSCFDELLSLGLITLTPPATAQRAVRLPATPSQPGTLEQDSRPESSFMPSARSLLPESTLTESNLTTLSSPESLMREDYDGDADSALEDARRILMRAVRSEAPVAGSLTLIKLRRARSRGDLLALMPEVEARISRPLRRLTATQTLRHVRSLLVRPS
jgi:hypothetical protein